MPPSSRPAETIPRIEVLLVEDRASLRRVVRALIESDPRYKVTEAGAPDEAVAIAFRDKPGLAVVDLALGVGTTGLDLITSLKQRLPDLPILVLSMHSAEMHAPHAFRAGALGYVMKDSATEHLHDAMDAVLQGRIWPPAGAAAGRAV